MIQCKWGVILLTYDGDEINQWCGVTKVRNPGPEWFPTKESAELAALGWKRRNPKGDYQAREIPIAS